jgi:hypothetical protein
VRDPHAGRCWVDEIMAGFGRTGRMWGCDHEGVVPDIMAISKNTGGGIPSGAVLTRAEIAGTFQTSAAPTFAGNALACAAGLAATKVILDGKLWENAAAMEAVGEYLLHMQPAAAAMPASADGLELVRGERSPQRMRRIWIKMAGVMVTYPARGTVPASSRRWSSNRYRLTASRSFDQALQAVVG